MDIIESGAEPPHAALLLTFDDGYIDHFTQVFPILDKKKLPALFFPSAKSILENEVLDVNKLHFILASTSEKGELVEFINRNITRRQKDFSLKPIDYYWKAFGKPSRYDEAKVVYIKKMLQQQLPKSLRTDLINCLFERFVSCDERAFSQELYMNTKQLACLQRNGMYVGSHGYDHYWMDILSKEEQEKEIDMSLNFLRSIGTNTDRWIMCYPYGAYNDALLSTIGNRNCVAGLTVEVGIADLSKTNPLILPRLNTNDLPKDRNFKPNAWATKAMLSKNEN